MEDYLIAAAIGFVAAAGFAAVMDRRRNNRDELDRVGWVNWPQVMVLTLTGAMMTVMLIAAS